MTNTTLTLLIIYVIVYSAVIISAIVSIARKPVAWGTKWWWLLVLLIQPIGPIIYFIWGSKMLNKKAAIN
jgi:uncharacterized membrane protein YhaH (DUF805 family)